MKKITAYRIIEKKTKQNNRLRGNFEKFFFLCFVLNLSLARHHLYYLMNINLKKYHFKWIDGDTFA